MASACRVQRRRVVGCVMSVMESQMRIALPYRDTPYYQFPKGALVMGVRRSQSSQC
jgi:hypothetical protein